MAWCQRREIGSEAPSPFCWLIFQRSASVGDHLIFSSRFKDVEASHHAPSQETEKCSLVDVIVLKQSQPLIKDTCKPKNSLSKNQRYGLMLFLPVLIFLVSVCSGIHASMHGVGWKDWCRPLKQLQLDTCKLHAWTLTTNQMLRKYVLILIQYGETKWMVEVACCLI
jgi:hypothetical protein